MNIPFPLVPTIDGASDCILVGGERNSLDAYFKLMNTVERYSFWMGGGWNDEHSLFLVLVSKQLLNDLN
jgi:hypothetical protein